MMKLKNPTVFETNRILEIFTRVSESKTPVFSCFVNLEEGKEKARLITEANFLEFRRILPDSYQHHADEAFEELEFILSSEVNGKSRGFAFYFRTGSAPFCHWAQFQVPLKTSFTVGHHPVLLPLLELQDQYDRYFVLISTHEKARILEIHLGEAVQDRFWGSGKEWTRPTLSKAMTYRHYQSNMADRGDTFFQEKVGVMTRLLESVKQKRLILAGYPENIEKLKKMLPSNLQQYVLDELPLSDKNDSDKIVMATLDKVVKQEMLESESKLEQVHQEYEKDGLLVLGAESCKDALLSGMVDTLVVTQSNRLNAPTWKADLRDWQSHQGIGDMSPLFESEKEEVLRLALENDVMVEFVHPDWLLDAHEGMGALLRYHSSRPTNFVSLSDIYDAAVQSA